MRRQLSLLLFRGVTYRLLCISESAPAAALDACDSTGLSTVGAVLLQKATTRSKVKPGPIHGEAESSVEDENDQGRNVQAPVASEQGIDLEAAALPATARSKDGSKAAEPVKTADSALPAAVKAAPEGVALVAWGAADDLKAQEVKTADRAPPAALKAAPEGVALVAWGAADEQKAPEARAHSSADEPAALDMHASSGPVAGNANGVETAATELDALAKSFEISPAEEAVVDSLRHPVISAALMGPAAGQASMAHDADASVIDKVAASSLDVLAAGVHMEYCKGLFPNREFLCDGGAVFLSLLVITPVIALSVAAFCGIVTGLRSLKQ